jgi:hypothetical protein
MTIKVNEHMTGTENFCRKNTIFKMSTRNFLRVAEFSTRNLDIPAHILLVLNSKFRALTNYNKFANTYLAHSTLRIR